MANHLDRGEAIVSEKLELFENRFFKAEQKQVCVGVLKYKRLILWFCNRSLSPLLSPFSPDVEDFDLRFQRC